MVVGHPRGQKGGSAAQIHKPCRHTSEGLSVAAALRNATRLTSESAAATAHSTQSSRAFIVVC